MKENITEQLIDLSKDKVEEKKDSKIEEYLKNIEQAHFELQERWKNKYNASWRLKRKKRNKLASITRKKSHKRKFKNIENSVRTLRKDIYRHKKV